MACNGQKALLPRAKTQGILREPTMTDVKNAEDPFATSPEAIVAMLHRELEHALKRLSAYIEKFGPIEEGEDEASSYGAIALGEATAIGLIDAEGRFGSAFGVIRLDDESRPVSDTILSDTVVEAGMAAKDRADEDLANYVSGVTPDWDDGMVCVAIHRAMVRRARSSVWSCRLVGHPHATEVVAVDEWDAAGIHALDLFRESEGEWMGGAIVVMPNGHPLAEALAQILDATVEIDEPDADDDAKGSRRSGVRAVVAEEVR
jgi:hypothetical protein